MSERSVPRAPVQDGVIVAEPSLGEVGDILTVNRRRLNAHADKRTLLGRSWTEMRRHARRSAVEAAAKYLEESSLTSIRNIEFDAIVAAGHQPELFHPGVWVKNFALCGLARALRATALNLVIDNDTLKTPALSIPVPSSRSQDPPCRRSVLFDRWLGESPFEERTIADRQLFADFAERVAMLMRDWHFEPMLPALWAEVLRQSQCTPLIGECFAAARRTFERQWGCVNLEVPLSTLCDSEPFAWFAGDLLADLPRFHETYNSVADEYRRRHGIRNRNRPVPDLAADGDWLEAPLWGWRAGAARRGRLFARRHVDHLELRCGGDEWPTLPFPRQGRAEAMVKAWPELRAQGFKIRSRALTTTLYARLFLADVFIHGIGGGKYDELTDELMRRVYDCEPPIYLVLSATRWLPLPHFAVTQEDRRQLKSQLRDLRYNPQRHLDARTANTDIVKLADRKKDLIAQQPETANQRYQRFRTLRTLTEQLRRSLRPREEQLRQKLAECERQLRVNAVSQRRDYSFCLFPESVLRPFCASFLNPSDPNGRNVSNGQ